jgi:hypothetical protein
MGINHPVRRTKIRIGCPERIGGGIAKESTEGEGRIDCRHVELLIFAFPQVLASKCFDF